MDALQNKMRCQRIVYWKYAIIACILLPHVFWFIQWSKETQSTAGSELCQPGRPCSYNDKVDFRIIVMTYNRPWSLVKLLKTIDVLELDKQSTAVEIWIDRNKKTQSVDAETVKVAMNFKWSGGSSRVHIQKAHVGIYGQWIDTWRPHDDSDDELALFLEDDSSISMYTYRWIRAVFRAYGHRTDFAGASLTSYQRKTFSDKRNRELVGPKNHTALMYKCFEPWGFSPKPKVWRRFQVSLALFHAFKNMPFCHQVLNSHASPVLTATVFVHVPEPKNVSQIIASATSTPIPSLVQICQRGGVVDTWVN